MSGEIAPQVLQEANYRTYSHARRAHATFGQNIGPAQAGSRMISPQDRSRLQDHEDLQDNEVVVIEETTTQPPNRWLHNARIQDKTHRRSLVLCSPCWRGGGLCDFGRRPERRPDQVLQIPNRLRFFFPQEGGLEAYSLDHEECKTIFLKLLSLRNAGSKIFDHQVREKLNVVVKEDSVQGAKCFKFSQTMGWPKTRSCRGNGWPPVQFRR
ncbi:hypothetical protein BDZ97DRAFT_2053456 [Flammula alnicola]|nr:hypothetical protein BDZ97DRAFT_2053456 [Flammula alnicola]